MKYDRLSYLSFLCLEESVSFDFFTTSLSVVAIECVLSVACLDLAVSHRLSFPCLIQQFTWWVPPPRLTCAGRLSWGATCPAENCSHPRIRACIQTTYFASTKSREIKGSASGSHFWTSICTAADHSKYRGSANTGIDKSH